MVIVGLGVVYAAEHWRMFHFGGVIDDSIVIMHVLWMFHVPFVSTAARIGAGVIVVGAFVAKVVIFRAKAPGNDMVFLVLYCMLAMVPMVRVALSRVCCARPQAHRGVPTLHVSLPLTFRSIAFHHLTCSPSYYLHGRDVLAPSSQVLNEHYSSYNYVRNKKLSAEKRDIEAIAEHSHLLLCRILPEQVVEQMHAGRKIIADHFRSVTIVFTDLKVRSSMRCASVCYNGFYYYFRFYSALLYFSRSGCFRPAAPTIVVCLSSRHFIIRYISIESFSPLTCSLLHFYGHVIKGLYEVLVYDDPIRAPRVA